MNDLNVTKGKGFSVFPSRSIREFEPYSQVGVQNSTGQIVATCGPARNVHSVPNAEIISELFNVYNDIGLSPVQVVERMNDLLKVAKEAVKAIEHLPENALGYHQIDDHYTGEIKEEYPVRDELIHELKGAINRAEVLKNE